jgi:hypothetical protein
MQVLAALMVMQLGKMTMCFELLMLMRRLMVMVMLMRRLMVMVMR